jgi:hypothetical protein
MTDDGDGDKSFRERVEEIRQRRAEERADADGSGMPTEEDKSVDSYAELSVDQWNGVPSMNMNVNTGGTGPAGMTQDHWQGARVRMELGDEVLEFTDATVLRSEVGGNVLYGVPSRPDRREQPSEADPGSASDAEPSGGDPTSTETIVYTGEANAGGRGGEPDRGTTGEGHAGSSLEVNFCPGCGVDLSAAQGASFCPECGHDLSTV